MKRKWLYIGVAAASVLQFLFERTWHELIFTNSYGDFHSVLKGSPQSDFMFLSEAAFALVVGFFYLHVPDQKRSLRSGMTIGSILGLLVGMCQMFGWYGTFTCSLSVVVMEIIKMIFRGFISGAAISAAELKTNPRSKPSAAIS